MHKLLWFVKKKILLKLDLLPKQRGQAILELQNSSIKCEER